MSDEKMTAEPTKRVAVSIMEAGKLVGVSRRTIYNWINSNKVEYVRTAGGRIQVFVDSLWRTSGARDPQYRPQKTNRRVAGPTLMDLILPK